MKESTILRLNKEVLSVLSVNSGAIGNQLPGWRRGDVVNLCMELTEEGAMLFVNVEVADIDREIV